MRLQTDNVVTLIIAQYSRKYVNLRDPVSETSLSRRLRRGKRPTLALGEELLLSTSVNGLASHVNTGEYPFSDRTSGVCGTLASAFQHSGK